MIRQVSIEKLAPTGEGVVRSGDKVGFVAGALAGEQIEAEVVEERRRFWKGRTVRVISASLDRIEGPHASCPGCDWAHFEPAAARDAKRGLFLEVMERIGKLPGGAFGELPIETSPPGYRLRNRFHVDAADGSARVGLFAPRTHRVESIAGCEAISLPTREALPAIASAIESSGAPVRQITTIEDRDAVHRVASFALGPDAAGDTVRLQRGLEPLFDGIRIVDSGGRRLRETGLPRLTVRIAARELLVVPDAFFQANRFLVTALFEQVRAAAGEREPSSALDAYGGVGLFAGALLDAGHSPTTVEESSAAVECARETRRRWNAANQWEIVRSTVEDFFVSSPRRFGVAVADPPRGGVGAAVARALAAQVSGRIILVSCDPATLARDLPICLAAGWRIQAAKLYDLFAFTHRVEAVVVLDRERA